VPSFEQGLRAVSSLTGLDFSSCDKVTDDLFRPENPKIGPFSRAVQRAVQHTVSSALSGSRWGTAQSGDAAVV
jgi:hypothetical protein